MRFILPRTTTDNNRQTLWKLAHPNISAFGAIIQDIKLNPRQIWCSYLFASKICVHFATQILERERFMIYFVFSDRTIGNHWSENRILIKLGKGKYLVFLPRQTDNQICFWSRNVTSFELPLHTSQKHCGGIIMKSLFGTLWTLYAIPRIALRSPSK